MSPGSIPSIDEATVRASIRGIVVDEFNMPVPGANVSSGTQSTTTDRYGVFRFNNIILSKNNGFVKVSKAGFFPGSRSFVSTEGRTHNLRIQMITRSNSGSFIASSGGTIELSNGIKLKVPASAIITASGANYSGTVDASIAWIDPTRPNLPNIMPGDLRGISENGEERILQSFVR